MMSGEYDCSCTPERMFATAKRIKGSKPILMEGIGHFPMSENPDLFKQYLKCQDFWQTSAEGNTNRLAPPIDEAHHQKV